MITVFRVGKNVNEYQYLLADSREDSLKIPEDCKPKKQDWEPISFYNPMPFLKDCHFLQFDLGYMIITKHLPDEIKYNIEVAGEILPIINTDDPETPYWVVNILNCVNCLDKDKTVKRGGIIQKYEFHKRRLPKSGLFKIPETHRGQILLCVHSADAINGIYTFKDHYDALELEGLIFEEIWRSEEE